MKKIFGFIIELFLIIGDKLWESFVWLYTWILGPLMSILAICLLFSGIFRGFIIVAIINRGIIKLIEHFDLYHY